ncbi:Saccharopine dehydrogenase-like oxidoreductase [Halotydeus destructor]|nr:Saccharopine dehydrogenase-like oxidoreductase [Halotydeus destructor]
MSFDKREFQVIIFGASGFTGEFVVEDLAKYVSKNRLNLKWAVSGRSESKVSSVLKSCGQRTGLNLDKTCVIEADANDAESLNKLARRTHVLINCTGPFRYYGEPVVKACVENGTNYLDITGEPQFMEMIQLKYFKQAQEKKIFVINACGFDSIPCEVCVQHLRDHFEGELSTVETYLVLSGGDRQMPANSTTWDCAVEAVADSKELKKTRKQLFSERFPNIPEPNQKYSKRKSFFRYSDDLITGWGLPFVGSDRSVVRRSQLSNFQNYGEVPVATECYVVQSTFQTMLLFMIGIFIIILAPFKFGRDLLKGYPSFFTFGLFRKNGVPREEVDAGFFAMTAIGRGRSSSANPEEGLDKEMIVRVEGPHPGYTATSLFVIQCLMTLLEERRSMNKDGGVLTPGAAFRKTTLIERLVNNGLIVKIVKG